jgi:hypothetical protein
MTDAQAMWTHVQNYEMGPVIPAADAAFAERAGVTRAEALEREPLGGEWVDTWLACLQEAVTAHLGAYYHALSGVSLGMPAYRKDVGTYGSAGIDEAGWSQLTYAVRHFQEQVLTALEAWQFMQARLMLGGLWEAMEPAYTYSTLNVDLTGSGPEPLPDGWFDLRPLLQ